MAAKEDHLLVVVGPRENENTILDAITDALPETGFTVSKVEGYGRGAGYRNETEAVHGRGERVRIELVLSRADVDLAVASLRALRSKSVAYWVAPVVEFGRCR